MQPGSRRCHRPQTVRENRLVAFAIHGLVLSRDIWRQWDMAEPFDRLADISLGCEANRPQPILSATHHFCRKLSISEFDSLSNSDFASRANQGFPFPRRYLSSEKNFNFRG